MAGKVLATAKRYLIYFHFSDPRFHVIKEAVRALPSRRFVPADAAEDGVAHWEVPRNEKTILLVANLAASYGMSFLDEGGKPVDAKSIKAQADADFKEATVASLAHSADPFPIKDLNPLMQPRPYQWAGVRYALLAYKRGFGVLIADDIGLGKTIEAIMLIAATGAYPALVLTLASVKIGFKRELEKWLPGKNIVMLEGRKAVNREVYQDADVIVANYDIIATVDLEEYYDAMGKRKTRAHPQAGTHLEQLLQLKLAGFILDECHKIKDYKTKTSHAATLLMRRVGNGLKVALTGTPILNRSQELLSTVMILDQLEELGGFWTFAKKYCGWVEGEGMGAAVVSEATRIELHNEMRGKNLYLRRLRKDVLADLPRTNDPQVVEIELSNRPAYRKALNATLDKLGQGYDRAEALVRLSLLRGLAAEGKLKGVKEWVANFLEGDEKLVVFADHIAVQEALRAEYPSAAYIAGAQTALKRQMQIDRFVEDPRVRLMVASLKAGGTGVDGLQKVCNDVAFVELGWNPGIMDQALGRLERSGQAEAVTPYYFIAPDTIDGDMLALLDLKRKLVAAILDGETADQLRARKALLTELGNDDGQSNLDIVKELAKRLYEQSGRLEVA